MEFSNWGGSNNTTEGNRKIKDPQTFNTPKKRGGGNTMKAMGTEWREKRWLLSLQWGVQLRPDIGGDLVAMGEVIYRKHADIGRDPAGDDTVMGRGHGRSAWAVQLKAEKRP